MSEKASLPSTFYEALSKVFAEFAKVLDKVKSLWRWRKTTMELLPSARLRGTLQRQHEWAPMRSVCVEYVARHSATMIALPVSFPSTIVWHSAYLTVVRSRRLLTALCQVSRFANSWTLDKYGCAEPRVFVECRFFAERYTLQSFLCRVPENLPSGNFDK